MILLTLVLDSLRLLDDRYWKHQCKEKNNFSINRFFFLNIIINNCTLFCRNLFKNLFINWELNLQVWIYIDTVIFMHLFLFQGIRANMKRMYNLITETQFTACQNQSKYKKLLFALCYFHSVLIERKKFEQLGWNVVYSFNDSDFDVSFFL